MDDTIVTELYGTYYFRGQYDTKVNLSTHLKVTDG